MDLDLSIEQKTTALQKLLQKYKHGFRSSVIRSDRKYASTRFNTQHSQEISQEMRKCLPIIFVKRKQSRYSSYKKINMNESKEIKIKSQKKETKRFKTTPSIPSFILCKLKKHYPESNYYQGQNESKNISKAFHPQSLKKRQSAIIIKKKQKNPEVTPAFVMLPALESSQRYTKSCQKQRPIVVVQSYNMKTKSKQSQPMTCALKQSRPQLAARWKSIFQMKQRSSLVENTIKDKIFNKKQSQIELTGWANTYSPFQTKEKSFF